MIEIQSQNYTFTFIKNLPFNGLIAKKGKTSDSITGLKYTLHYSFELFMNRQPRFPHEQALAHERL